MAKIAINGFGRIGRRFLRQVLSAEKPAFDVVAINDLTDAATLAHLFKYDSVHGTFGQPVRAQGNYLVVGDKKILIIAEKDPKALPWKDLGIDIVVESTGLFTSREKAALHQAAGAKRVILSAPGTGVDLTVCFGINHTEIKATDTIISNASCTTNCLAPLAKVIDDNFGIESGVMTTIHSYTNDQRILDLPHKDLRRARAAAVNMIPTSTGAAKAIGLVLPKLNGKLDGLAIRVPTPNVSLVDLVVQVKTATNAKAVNAAFTKAAKSGPMKGVLIATNDEIVSSDVNGSVASSVVDLGLTQVMNNKTVKVLSWYDNETGYSSRLVDVTAYVAKKFKK